MSLFYTPSSESSTLPQSIPSSNFLSPPALFKPISYLANFSIFLSLSLSPSLALYLSSLRETDKLLLFLNKFASSTFLLFATKSALRISKLHPLGFELHLSFLVLRLSSWFGASFQLLSTCKSRCNMQKVCWPYFDPEFDSLAERIYGPSCSVSIDNDSLEDCTMVKVDSVNKQDLLLEVVQVLTDMNLVISKGYISSDSSWFMDVLHVKDAHGNKLKDQRVIDYIQKALSSSGSSASPKVNTFPKVFELEPHSEHTAIEMTGPDRPGLFSEISAALTDLHCNVVEAHAWSHNARLACIAYISDQSTDSPIDGRRLAAIEGHLATVLRATTTPSPDWHEEVKTAGLPEGDGTMTTVERRLHQLMLSVRDFDRPTQSPGTPTMALGSNPGDEKERKATVKVENCDEKGYSIVTVRCWDRPRLMFDTVCTLIDMQYVISHASVDSRAGFAFQEYFIRHIDGNAMNTESEKERVIKCLEAALERRVCEGVRLELRAKSRVGLLSDITRVLRENGLVVLRADIATQGEKVDHAFYIRDVSGNEVDMEFVESMKKEILGPIDLAVKKTQVPPSSPPKTPLSSITDKLKYQIERLICL